MIALTTPDFIICIIYLLFITGLGAYFYKGQKTTKDFFLAGKSMGWLPVGLSLMATLTSGIGYIGQPTGALKFGIMTIWGLLAIPLSFPIVIWVFMPFYHRLNVYTAYEYMEKRFNVSIRSLTSGIFIIWRITWMATAIYVPSMVLNVVTDGKLPLIPSIIVLGILATLYTAMGGVKAVIWTDVFQFIIMFGGMITAAVLIVMNVDGGIPGIWNSIEKQGMTNFIAHLDGWDNANILEKFKLYLYTDATVLAIIVSYTVGKLGNYCVDQVMVQRYLTARDLKTSRMGFVCNCFAYCFYILSMTLVGAALIAFSQEHNFPENLQKDQIFPYFITNVMPVGIAGLMIASIYAASMSSLDSGVNSCITAFTNDFYNRFWLRKKTLEDKTITTKEQSKNLYMARIASLILGIIVTFLACFVGSMGDVFVISAKLINGFIGPLFGLFILAMFTKKAHAYPVLIAGIIGSFITGLTIFAEKLGFDTFEVGIMWPSTIGVITTVTLGYVLSWIIPEPSHNGRDWTFIAVMKKHYDNEDGE